MTAERINLLVDCMRTAESTAAYALTTADGPGRSILLDTANHTFAFFRERLCRELADDFTGKYGGKPRQCMRATERYVVTVTYITRNQTAVAIEDRVQMQPERKCRDAGNCACAEG